MDDTNKYLKSPLVRAIRPSLLLTRDVLFQSPFPARHWLVLGLIVLLESMAAGIGSQSMVSSYAAGPIAAAQASVRRLSGLLQWCVDNMLLAFVAAIVVLPLICGFGALVFWLSSRGQVMFVHAVVDREFVAGRLWMRSSAHARQVWRFLVAFNGAFLLVLLAILLLLLVQSLSLSDGARLVFWSMLQTTYPILFMALPLGLVFWAVNLLLRDMVIPIMIRYDLTIMEAWSRFVDVTRANLITIALFVAIRAVFQLVMFGVKIVVGILTCVGFLPYVSQVLLAPFHLFDRAYSLYVLNLIVKDFRLMDKESGSAVAASTSAAA